MEFSRAIYSTYVNLRKINSLARLTWTRSAGLLGQSNYLR